LGLIGLLCSVGASLLISGVQVKKLLAERADLNKQLAVCKSEILKLESRLQVCLQAKSAVRCC
jgi:hypothetical protein